MLIGPKLRLKPLELSDATLAAEWFSDPEYLGSYYNVWPQTRVGWEKAIAKYADEKYEDEGTFLILRSEDREPLGMIGYYTPASATEFYHGLEIWYQVHPKARRQRVATQASMLLVNHLFSAVPVARIEATTVVGNEASDHVLGLAGLTHEGILRNKLFLHGQYQNMNLYSITRDDWQDEERYRQDRDF
jgi:RimJ/RimL family protein N-acetyltransferase